MENKNDNIKYIVIGVVVVIIVVSALFFFSQNKNNSNQNHQVEYTGDRTQFIQSYQNVNETKICEKDKDCGLSECGGCYSQDFLDSKEPELPCSKFEDYVCICEMGACTEVKR